MRPTPRRFVNSMRRLPPVWLMGLSNATLGFSNGITLFVIPQLMAEAHVLEAKIATITAVAISANFWFVLFGPILDVRFSRRWYATFFAALSGIAATVAVLSVHRLIVLQIATVICMAAAPLSSSALGGWLSNITPHEQKNPLSKWMNIALISGSGVIIALGGELVHGLPLFAAAVVMGAIVVLPAAVFPFHARTRTGPPSCR
jgi:PAT family beta-lactamase induction signal transducer AmpG